MDEKVDLRIVRTWGDSPGHYRFIIWDPDTKRNVWIDDVGEWSSWDEFIRSAGLFCRKNQQSKDDALLDDPVKGSPAWLSSQLNELVRVKNKPEFVTAREVVLKREAKSRFLKWENWVVWVFSFGFLAFFVWLLASAAWDGGRYVLKQVGIIDYPTKTEMRYNSFVLSVSNCVRADEVYGANKSDKWPVYAVYRCPDGSRRIWKNSIEVIRERGNSIIVD